MSYTLADLLTGQLHYSEDTAPPALSQREFNSWLEIIKEDTEKIITDVLIHVLILMLRGISVSDTAIILNRSENTIISNRKRLIRITKLSRCQYIVASYTCDHLPSSIRSQIKSWRDSWIRSFSKQSDPKFTITERECQILDMLLRGSSSISVAITLGISTRTAETHIANLLSKLGFDKSIKALAHFTHYVHHHCLPDLHLEAA